MSQRTARTDASMGQLGLACAMRRWLFERPAQKYLEAHGNRPHLFMNDGRLRTHWFFSKAARRDLQSILHSEDVANATKVHEYRNPFRGMPGRWDPLVEHVLRRYVSHYRKKYEHILEPDYLAECPSLFFWQSLLRYVGAIHTEWCTEDRATCIHGMCLVFSLLWRVLAISEKHPCHMEFWDDVPLVSERSSGFEWSTLQSVDMPDPPRKSKEHMSDYFPDDIQEDAMKAFQDLRCFLDEDAVRRDASLELGAIAMAARVRSRDMGQHNNYYEEASRIVHGADADIRDRRRQASNDRSRYLQDERHKTANPYWKQQKDATAFNQMADSFFESMKRDMSTSAFYSTYDPHREYALQRLLPHIKVAFWECATHANQAQQQRQSMLKHLLCPLLNYFYLEIGVQYDAWTFSTAHGPFMDGINELVRRTDWDWTELQTRWTASREHPNRRLNPSVQTELMRLRPPSLWQDPECQAAVREATEYVRREWPGNFCGDYGNNECLNPIFTPPNESVSDSDALASAKQNVRNHGYFLLPEFGMRKWKDMELDDAEWLSVLAMEAQQLPGGSPEQMNKAEEKFNGFKTKYIESRRPKPQNIPDDMVETMDPDCIINTYASQRTRSETLLKRPSKV